MVVNSSYAGCREDNQTRQSEPRKRPLRLTEEIITSKSSGVALVTFIYINDNCFSLSCNNAALYNSIESKRIQIPKEDRETFNGLRSVSIEDPTFPRAFFKYVVPKRFPESDYSYFLKLE